MSARQISDYWLGLAGYSLVPQIPDTATNNDNGVIQVG
jgi:hypothetical protein